MCHLNKHIPQSYQRNNGRQILLWMPRLKWHYDRPLDKGELLQLMVLPITIYEIRIAIINNL